MSSWFFLATALFLLAFSAFSPLLHKSDRAKLKVFLKFLRARAAVGGLEGDGMTAWALAPSVGSKVKSFGSQMESLHRSQFSQDKLWARLGCANTCLSQRLWENHRRRAQTPGSFRWRLEDSSMCTVPTVSGWGHSVRVRSGEVHRGREMLIAAFLKTLLMLNRVWLFLTLWTVPARLLCPWDFPGKNTIFPTQESSLAKWILYLPCYLRNPIICSTYLNI